MLGVMMSGIDTSAVVLALPVMIQELHSDIISMIWVIMGYLLVITILGTQVGKLGDMFGRVKMYNLGFAIFTFGSLLCGFSGTGSELIAFRVVQGLGGALLTANAGAIIADTFAVNERGRAYGITGAGYSIGAILGILVGGAFVTFLSWRYIFFINLPIGVIATAVGVLKLRERSPIVKTKIDVGGITILGAALFLLLYGMTNTTGSGVETNFVAELFAGLLLIPAFVLYERRSSHPLLDLSLLKRRIIGASFLAAFFQSLAGFAVLFLLIMYLQGPRDMTPWSAALLLIPGYVLGGFIAPFTGRLSDKLGARVIASAGLSLQICGLLVYSTLGLTTPTYVVVSGAILNGAGNSSFFPANNSAVMASAPPRAYGVISGLLRTFSNIGMVCSFAVALLIASLSIPRQTAFQIFLGVGKISGPLASAFINGMHVALAFSIAVLLLGVLLSALRGKEARTAGVTQSPT
ncbi:MAG: MFS transporter [Nitrososphaerota archaeon]|nr:MFS transporter [Nitrososphaerota archaeon]